MPEIKISCPHCGQHFSGDESHQGARIDCPTCHVSFQVPYAPSSAKPPPPPPLRTPSKAAPQINPRSGVGAPAAAPDSRRSGLAITSMVLGIVSVVLSVACVGVLAGIPAIICGHIAHGRARKQPAQFGGGGMAIAGFTTGYLSLILSLALLGFMLPTIEAARRQAQRQAQPINYPPGNVRNITTVQPGGRPANVRNIRMNPAMAQAASLNNLRQISQAFHTWANKHHNQFPFNVSQAQGGTLELCNRDSDGYELNPVPTYQVLAKSLMTPRFLVCMNDDTKQPAPDFDSLQATNISYQLRTGPNVTVTNWQEILAVDPINGLVLYCDGRATPDARYQKKQ